MNNNISILYEGISIPERDNQIGSTWHLVQLY